MQVKTGYIYKKNRLKMTSLNIVYKIGSCYELEGKRGVMHLMEHLIAMFFKKYENRFLNDCIGYNAYTSSNYITVLFNGLNTKLTPSFKKELVYALLNSFNDITVDEFNNEKKVVIQEILDTYEEPTSGNLYNILYDRFNFTTAAGIPEQVEKFTFNEAKQLFNEIFTKPTRIVEVGPESTDFKNIEYKTDYLQSNIYKYKKPTGKIIKNVPKGDKTNVYVIGKKLVKKSDYKYIAIALDMLTAGLTSPLYNEIRLVHGLSYYVSSDLITLVDDSIIFMNACTSEENVQKLINIFTEICNNIEKYLDKERFDNIINLITTKKEINKCLLYNNCDEYMYQEAPTIPDNLKKITFEKVVAVTKKYLSNIEIIAK